MLCVPGLPGPTAGASEVVIPVSLGIGGGAREGIALSTRSVAAQRSLRATASWAVFARRQPVGAEANGSIKRHLPLAAGQCAQEYDQLTAFGIA
jgi:hypothetical protein